MYLHVPTIHVSKQQLLAVHLLSFDDLNLLDLCWFILNPSIDGHVEQATRADDVEDMINILKETASPTQ